MVSAVVITGIKPPVKIRPNKKLGITDELAKEINKYRLIKQEAEILNKSLKSYGYDTAKQIKYDRYVKQYENHLEYIHTKSKTDISDGKPKRQTIKSQTQTYKEFVGDDQKIFDIDIIKRKAESDPEGANRFLEKVEEALKDPSIDPMIKQHVEKTVVSPLKIGIGVSVIAVTQTSKNQQGITMHIKNVVLNDPFKRGVVNMARRDGISKADLEKLMNMEPEKLHILYDMDPQFFDEYFKYPEDWYDTGIDDYFTGDIGYKDVIDLYEKTFGVKL